jgi:hypothetical protein
VEGPCPQGLSTPATILHFFDPRKRQVMLNCPSACRLEPGEGRDRARLEDFLALPTDGLAAPKSWLQELWGGGGKGARVQIFAKYYPKVRAGM